MAINALVITGPDPGAVPGGSTISFPRTTFSKWAEWHGAETGSTDG